MDHAANAPGIVATRIIEAATDAGFITTASLAAGLGVGRDKIVEAYDLMETAGIRLMRIRGMGGGIAILGAAAAPAEA